MSITALGFLNSTVATTVPRPASGSFYLIAVVDDLLGDSGMDDERELCEKSTMKQIPLNALLAVMVKFPLAPKILVKIGNHWLNGNARFVLVSM